ncbi:MAG: hypothetical protein MSG64_18510 [Pyrinomonadaceae bacterium MAG19_C2-C3]|nr:hypothetical protein [Pyrinomonadaceae bacterium MAG19_C2-C3]
MLKHATLRSRLPETPLPFKAQSDAQVVLSDNLVTRRVRLVCLVAAIVLGALNAWAERYSVNADGISYLDMGDAFFRGDWAMAFNPYWGPLYAWLLGAANAVFQPSAYWEYPLVHVINFLIYIFAVFCFDLLVREVLRRRQQREAAFADAEDSSSPPASNAILEGALVALAYSIFIWASLELITQRLVTPDMLVAAFAYLASALLLRIRRGAASTRTFLALGATLGIGYLAKTVFFPLGFVFLTVALLATWTATKDWKRAVRYVGFAAAVFLAICSVWILAISANKGRLTIGESSQLTYTWITYDIPFRNWQGERTGGVPQHPTRKLLERPALYEFAAPVPGTYPVWYDPSYWHEGIASRFDLQRQVVLLAESAARYRRILFSYLQISLLVGWLLLIAYAAWRQRSSLKDVFSEWVLLLPALAALALYALVTVEPRLVGGFALLLWLGLFSAVRPPREKQARMITIGMFVFLAAVMSLLIVTRTTPRVIAASANGDAAHEAWRVAEGLQQAGLGAGDRAAIIYPSRQASPSRMVSWARLAESQIIAEIPSDAAADFWAADAATKERVYELLAQSGARFVLTEKPPLPDATAVEGWQRIELTNFYVRTLAPSR